MHIKGKYKEILFIVDTCEAEALFDFVTIPNIYFVGSSIRTQKASSFSFDYDIMGPTMDRFSYKLFTSIERIKKHKKNNYSINDLFNEIKQDRAFLDSDVIIFDRIKRKLLFKEFFGEIDPKNKIKTQIVPLDKALIEKEHDSTNFILKYNENLNSKLVELDNEITQLNKFESKEYYMDYQNLTKEVKTQNYVFCSIFLFLFVLIFINIIS